MASISGIWINTAYYSSSHQIPAAPLALPLTIYVQLNITCDHNSPILGTIISATSPPESPWHLARGNHEWNQSMSNVFYYLPETDSKPLLTPKYKVKLTSSPSYTMSFFVKCLCNISHWKKTTVWLPLPELKPPKAQRSKAPPRSVRKKANWSKLAPAYG
ncbi:hypothetical protein DSO57_1009690 [Entomophthora muscae]|uniref:Uncharacterized protein n=1 Tax=Entomophthora muscae TaxID=34485 RepID=A0ACC2THB9_9FUNG|nr:hypothetical protein DSO57_1009690 [Entomophthora muscae]